MIYTPKTKKAMKLCFEAHKGQIDKSGMISGTVLAGRAPSTEERTISGAVAVPRTGKIAAK